MTMCNVDRHIKVSDAVVAKYVLPTRSYTHTLGQVLPVQNRFMVLQTDTQTQDTDSTRDDHWNNSLQNSQLLKQVRQSVNMDVGISERQVLLGSFSIVLDIVPIM